MINDCRPASAGAAWRSAAARIRRARRRRRGRRGILRAVERRVMALTTTDLSLATPDPALAPDSGAGSAGGVQARDAAGQHRGGRGALLAAQGSLEAVKRSARCVFTRLNWAWVRWL